MNISCIYIYKETFPFLDWCLKLFYILPNIKCNHRFYIFSEVNTLLQAKKLGKIVYVSMMWCCSLNFGLVSS